MLAILKIFNASATTYSLNDWRKYLVTYDEDLNCALLGFCLLNEFQKIMKSMKHDISDETIKWEEKLELNVYAFRSVCNIFFIPYCFV